MKWWKLLLIAVLFSPMIGCEAKVDADDDDAELKIKVDD